jgi:hypothetical protein
MVDVLGQNFDLPYLDDLLSGEGSEMSEARNARSLTGSPGFPVVISRLASFDALVTSLKGLNWTTI